MSDLENQRLMEQISQLAGKFPQSCKQFLPVSMPDVVVSDFIL